MENTTNGNLDPGAAMEGRRITKERLLKLLDSLSPAQDEWFTVYLTSESLLTRSKGLTSGNQNDRRPADISSLIENESLQRALQRYHTGLVLFRSDASVLAVVPPFPVTEDAFVVGAPHTEPLRDILQRPRRTLLILVTWGAYMIALYSGDSLIRHKKGTGHIHPPHKKGGSSQGRFARRTEEQRKEFLKRVGGHIDAELVGETVEHIYFGGNRLILRPLMADSRFLRDHTSLLSPRTLLVKRASRDALDGAFIEASSGLLFQSR